MKLLLLLSLLFISFNVVQAQEIKIDFALPEPKKISIENKKEGKVLKNKFAFLQSNKTDKKIHLREEFFNTIESIKENENPEIENENENDEKNLILKPKVEIVYPKTDFGKLLRKPPPAKKKEESERFHWKPALVESFYFLGIQHSFRMFQKKTRRELDGKFFKEWGKSAKNLGGWRDGDGFFTNYIAHPMQGAVTGRIFINNSDASKKLEFGKSKKYWQSRLKAMIWSGVWSTQFELGPISEASIGNVGLYDDVAPNRMGWVDLVVTPTVGTATLIGEDMVDKFILKKWLERKSKSRTKIKLLRTFLTPFQSFTNVLRGKAPWRRDNR